MIIIIYFYWQLGTKKCELQDELNGSVLLLYQYTYFRVKTKQNKLLIAYTLFTQYYRNYEYKTILNLV